MSQQFCLKWNNHTTNMLQVFESLLSTEALVDVTLACDGLSLKAHKMVLSACSPFFQSLFLENPCKHPIVIMKDMRYCDLKAIIDFMYRGEVNVSHDQLSALLKTAETLKVKGLAEVTGENRQASGIVQQEITTPQSVPTPTPVPVPPTAQRTDTPPLQGKRKRGRPRKRSLSDSNRSDDDGVVVPPKIKEPNSDLDELSGDVSMEAPSDIRGGGCPVSSNSLSQVPIHSSNNVNMLSKSHLSSPQDPQVEEPTSGDENEFEVEPSKLLEQTLTTTENVPSSNHNSTGHISLPSGCGLEISKRTMSSSDSASQVPSSVPSDSLGSNLQGPDSPQDIKPQISFDDPPTSPIAGTSHGSDRSLMMYMDQAGVSSVPGPSNFEGSSALVPLDSQPQDLSWKKKLPNKKKRPKKLAKHSLVKKGKSRNSEIIGYSEELLKQSKQLLIFSDEGRMRAFQVNKDVDHVPDPFEFPPALDNSLHATLDFEVAESPSNDEPPDLTSDCNLNDSGPFAYPEPNNLACTCGDICGEDDEKYDPEEDSFLEGSFLSAPEDRVTDSINIDFDPHIESSFSLLEDNVTDSLGTKLSSKGDEKVPMKRSQRNVKTKSAREMLMIRTRRKVSSGLSKLRKRKFSNRKEPLKKTVTDRDEKTTSPGTGDKFLQKQVSGELPGTAVPSLGNKTLEKCDSKEFLEATSPSTGDKSLQQYGPKILPPGWTVQAIKRLSGKTAGLIDVYMVTPDGKRLRSRNEVAAYIQQKKLPISADEFIFNKSAYSDLLHDASYSKY